MRKIKWFVVVDENAKETSVSEIMEMTSQNKRLKITDKIVGNYEYKIVEFIK
jgi:hypothetical protein